MLRSLVGSEMCIRDRSYNEDVGDKSLYLFNCYLNGFLQGEQFQNERNIRDFFFAFQKWMEQKYECTLSQSWCNILRFHTGNEKEAFELFYYELDQFNKSSYFENSIPADQNNHNTNAYGAVHVLGDDIDAIKFKQEQYNNCLLYTSPSPRDS